MWVLVVLVCVVLQKFDIAVTFRKGNSFHRMVKDDGYREEVKEEEEGEEGQGEEEEEEEEEEMANVTLRVAGDREEGPDKLDKSVEAKSTTSSLWLCSSLVIKETPPMRLKPMKAGSGTGGDVSR
jgi:hypothetical protein